MLWLIFDNRRNYIAKTSEYASSWRIYDRITPKVSLLSQIWCSKWDSNPHALRHRILSAARLPIPSFEQINLFYGGKQTNQ